MAVNQNVSAISTAPQLGVDSKEVFVQKAETVWAELKTVIPELNTAFTEINTTETNINNKESNVVAKEALMSPHYTAIDSVYANAVNINTIATNISNVNTVGTNISDVVLVADNVVNIDAVALNILDVNTTAFNILNVNTVATNISNVNTVATNISNVNTVATNIADIDTVVANLTDIQNAEENAQIAVGNAAVCLSATNNKGAWSNLTGALSVPATTTHNNATWILNVSLADITLSEPSESNADWTRSGIASLFDDKAPKLGANLDLNGFDIPAKQDALTFDSVPTDGSTNPVESNGVFDALATKQNTLVSGTNIKTINDISVLGSGNIEIKATDANIVSVAINTTMVKNTHYIVTVDAKTLTLPATPTVGDKVMVSVEDFYTTIIARNGSNIMGLAEDMVIDTNNITVELQYINSTEGWRLV